MGLGSLIGWSGWNSEVKKKEKRPRHKPRHDRLGGLSLGDLIFFTRADFNDLISLVQGKNVPDVFIITLGPLLGHPFMQPYIMGLSHQLQSFYKWK